MIKEVSRAIIVNDKGEVLLGKRSRGIAAGQFALIGGKLGEKETPREAIIREVKEEAGLRFSPLELFYHGIDDESDPGNSWMSYFFTGIVSGEPHLEPTEVQQIIYVAEEELDNVDIAFDHKERLKDFFASKKK